MLTKGNELLSRFNAYISLGEQNAVVNTAQGVLFAQSQQKKASTGKNDFPRIS